MRYSKFSLTLLSEHKKAVVWLAIIAMVSLPISALAATATATVSKNTVEMNEPFQLTISVDENVSNNALNLTLLAKDFNYGRPQLSNSTSIINGTVSRLTQWRVALAAKADGRYTIPSFDLNGSKTLPITIISLPVKDDNQSGSGAAPDIDAIQVKATLNREQGYIGESFIYEVRLMLGTRVESPTLNAPVGEGFSVDQMEEDTQSETIINGRRYVIVRRQYQITPTQAGKLTIEGAVFTGTELTQNKWGTSLGIPLNRQAKSITLNIKDKPANYTGFWLPTPALELTQRFEPDALNDMAAEISSAKVGEPINRIITLKIKNIAQSAMPDLNINYPSSVRMYSDKPVYTEKDGFLVMRVQQVIIPREHGEITLPSMSIKWFNTQTGLEQTSDIAALTLNVEPGEILTNPQPVLPPSMSSMPNSAPSQCDATPSLLSSSYWPFATAFVTFLWLTTLVLYCRKSRALALPTKEVNFSSKNNALGALEEAVKRNDALRVATQYRQWNPSHLSASLQKEIDDEIQAMMASQYSKDAESWNHSHLLALLKKSKSHKETQSKKEALKDLD